jgi:hypothetical protein
LPLRLQSTPSVGGGSAFVVNVLSEQKSKIMNVLFAVIPPEFILVMAGIGLVIGVIFNIMTGK